MANITVSTAQHFIPEVWSDGVLEAVEFAGVIQKRVNREYEGEIKQGGDTVHVPHLSNLSTATKSASTDITFEALSQNKQDITIATHEYAAFKLEDIVRVQANQNLRSRYEKKIGYALVRGREVTLAGLFGSLSQIVGTLGVELTSDDYNSAWLKMAEAGLLEMSPDPGEDFSVFLSPAAYAALLKVDVFINRQYNPEGNAIQRAMVGDVYGTKVFMSNLLTTPASGQHNCAMIHKDCFSLAVQDEVPVRADYIIESLADGVVGHNIYGTAEMNFPVETPGSVSTTDNRGVLLRTV